MQPVISLANIGKTYPGPPEVQALCHTNFDVAPGNLVTIVGASRSGKSTLLNILGLLDTPTSGSYRLQGIETVGLGADARAGMRREYIGFVFQSFHLLQGRSAVENVQLGLTYSGAKPKQSRELARDALDTVGLAHRQDALAEQLSGGERQRVALARALIGRPRVLLCDEPTGNLDSRTSDGIIETILNLNANGSTVVLITHDHGIAAKLGNTHTIRDGAFVQAGTPA